MKKQKIIVGRRKGGRRESEGKKKCMYKYNEEKCRKGMQKGKKRRKE